MFILIFQLKWLGCYCIRGTINITTVLKTTKKKRLRNVRRNPFVSEFKSHKSEETF